MAVSDRNAWVDLAEMISRYKIEEGPEVPEDEIHLVIHEGKRMTLVARCLVPKELSSLVKAIKKVPDGS